MIPKIHAEFARYYDDVFFYRPYYEQVVFISSVLSRFSVRGRRLLDVGCGTGTVAQLLSEKGFSVTGIDSSDSMLRIARKKSKDVLFIQADMRDFSSPVPFDAVYSLFSVINYLPDYTALLNFFRNMFNVVAKGGLFIFEMGLTPSALKRYQPQQHSFKKDDFSLDSFFSLDVPRPFVRNFSLRLKYRVVDSGKHFVHTDIISQSAFSLLEVKSALLRAGFRQIKLFGGLFLQEFSSKDNIPLFVAVKK